MDINKKDLARMARLMYDLQQFCGERPDTCYDDADKECPLHLKDCNLDTERFPVHWDIKHDDVVRLEKEANE